MSRRFALSLLAATMLGSLSCAVFPRPPATGIPDRETSPTPLAEAAASPAVGDAVADVRADGFRQVREQGALLVFYRGGW